MKVIRTVAKLRAALDAHRERGRQIGFVPTMGSLHEGHLSLFDRAREECPIVVASIFVNPLQFGEGEDLDSYPRDLDGDLQKARTRGVDLAFVPSAQEMYPGGPPTVTVDPGPMAQRLCGPYRPGHFRGVLTVVAKLFQMVRPDVAVFGRKDLQQGVLVRRMTEDLNLPVRIVLAPIVREHDGLAMSSRNAFLVGEARAQAAGVSSTLRAVANVFADGVTDTAALRRAVDEHMDLLPGLDVQYADFVALDTLEEVSVADAETVLALAVLCGGTRLIDNRSLGAANG
jgi:pantoate--beta-alanine ligase